MTPDRLERFERVARAAGDPGAADDARDIVAQMRAGEANFVVFGQFKRGKSTLVNALLGADVMPTGPLPLTGITTVVRYGETPERLITFFDGNVRNVDALEDYVTEERNSHNRLGVKKVEVRWPAPAIEHMAIFDTPGVGSTYTWNTEAARDALPRTDGAIVVVGPEPPIGEQEAAFAREIVTSSDRLFVVLNKADTAGAHLDEIVRFTRGVLDANGVTSELYVLSARAAREAQKTENADPAFETFVAALQSFVGDSGDRAPARSIARRTRALVDRVRTIVAMRRSAASLPRVERERRLAALDDALRALEVRRRALELVVDDDAAAIGTGLEGELQIMQSRDGAAFDDFARSLAVEAQLGKRAELLEAFVARCADAWRREAIAFVEPLLHQNAAKYAREAAELERAIVRAGCEVLALDAEDIEPSEIRITSASFSMVSATMPTTGLEIGLLFAVSLLPRPLRVRTMLKVNREALRSELEALRGKLRYGMVRDLNRVQRATRQLLSEHVGGLGTAVRAAIAGDEEPAEDAMQTERRWAAIARELGDVAGTNGSAERAS